MLIRDPYKFQTYLPRDGASNSGLGPHMSIKNQENASVAAEPTGKMAEAIFKLRFTVPIFDKVITKRSH